MNKYIKINKSKLFKLIPTKLKNTIKSKIVWYFLPSDIKKNIVCNSVYRDIHKGQRCFILATGPSIAKQNLLKLKGEVCFSLADFFLHPQATQINPKYQVNAPHHPPFDDQIVKMEINGYKNKYNNNTIYFFGHVPYIHSFYSVFKNNPALRLKNTKYVNYWGAVFINEKNYLKNKIWDICGTPFICKSVVFLALQLAIYMGFKEIYLLGCDHDYLLKKLLNDSFIDNHFYKDEQMVEKGLPVPLPDYAYNSSEKFFESYYILWQQYRLIKEYAEIKGQHIYNATEGGILDVFDRVKYDDIVFYDENNCIK